MKQTQMYVLDLNKMEGNGAFSCPGCGNVISPDDCNEEVYSIIEPKVSKDGLEELVIRCGKCGSQLHLTGFSLLQDVPDVKLEELENEQKERTPCHVHHV
jgi:transcription initiation factor IIE alpha subunit